MRRTYLWLLPWSFVFVRKLRMRGSHVFWGKEPLRLGDVSARKTTADQNESGMAASAVLGERSGPMQRSKYSEEQIVYALRQVEIAAPISDLCRQLGVVEQTFYACKKKYAQLDFAASRDAFDSPPIVPS